MDILLVICAAVIYFIILFLVKFGFTSWRYFSVNAIVATANSSFYLLPFIIGPISYIIIVSYVLSLFDDISLEHIWLTVPVIAVLRVLCIVISSRLISSPLIWIVVLSFLSSGLAYGVQITVLQSITDSTEPSPLLVLATVIACLSVYALLNNARFGYLDEADGYEKMVLALYDKYTKRYKDVVPKWYKKDSRQYDIFFSIMITEDLNRPRVVRIVEKLASYIRPVGSTGIMQVMADTYLSNEKSIELAANIIKPSYIRHTKEMDDDYSVVRAVSGDYNGFGYEEIVSEIYFLIKKNRNV